MKPISKKGMRRRGIIIGAAGYLLVILYFCHLGHLKQTAEASPMLILEAAEHMLSDPLQLFPTDANMLITGLSVGTLVPLVTYTDYLRHRDLRPNKESGSANWNEDLKGFRKKYTDKPLQGAGSPNMILSKNIFLSMDTWKTNRNCNVMCIGAAGTGKSRGLIKPNILQANCSYVITDPSGELLDSMGGFLCGQGYEIRVFNLADMSHSDTYNPFRYIHNDEGVLTMITSLIKNTTPDGSHSSEPFWERAETALLEAVCFYVREMYDPEFQNFSTVMELLREAEAPEGKLSLLDARFDLFCKDHPQHVAVKSYAVYKAAGGGKTAQSILITCQTRLHTFNLSAVSGLTATDTLDLGTVGDKKVALFCITPAADTTFNFLASLMYTQLFDVLYHHAETECEGRRLPVHVRCLLDEFANIGTIPNFPQRLSTMRKYEISCTIILQALSQIKSAYKEEWEVIISNCDSFLFLGGTDKTTLEYISQTLGKETIRSMTTQQTKGRQGSYSMSYSKTGRDLLTTDELRVMDNKNCIYLLRGVPPFFTEKYNLLKHPNYSLCGDSDESMRYAVTKEKNTPHLRNRNIPGGKV